MNRRALFKSLAGIAGALLVPELFVPKRTFFLPPLGGWLYSSTDMHLSLDEFKDRFIEPFYKKLEDEIMRLEMPFEMPSPGNALIYRVLR